MTVSSVTKGSLSDDPDDDDGGNDGDEEEDDGDTSAGKFQRL